MDMRPSAASLPSLPDPYVNRVLVNVHWIVKEHRPSGMVVVGSFHNLLTNFGLTALAAAPAGGYVPPIYLVIESSQVAMYSSSLAGDTLVQITADPTIVGDTQMVLSVGLPAQETVAFNAITGSSAPFNVSLASPALSAHLAGDPVVRSPAPTDTITAVLSESQYDPTFNPLGRIAVTASFSPGVGQNTMQFFLSGLTATNVYFAHVGLADQQIIGAPNTNLHNYAAFGYFHNNTSDVEFDVTYTLTTF
jgi:hypothetical protein